MMVSPILQSDCSLEPRWTTYEHGQVGARLRRTHHGRLNSDVLSSPPLYLLSAGREDYPSAFKTIMTVEYVDLTHTLNTDT